MKLIVSHEKEQIIIDNFEKGSYSAILEKIYTQAHYLKEFNFAKIIIKWADPYFNTSEDIEKYPFKNENIALFMFKICDNTSVNVKILH